MSATQVLRCLAPQRRRSPVCDAYHTGVASFVPARPLLSGHNRLSALTGQLQSLGLAGVLAYGILNTVYYTAAFFSIWVWAVGAPRGEVFPDIDPKQSNTATDTLCTHNHVLLTTYANHERCCLFQHNLPAVEANLRVLSCMSVQVSACQGVSARSRKLQRSRGPAVRSRSSPARPAPWRSRRWWTV